MEPKKILFPVCDRLRTRDVARYSFWLARHLPAELYLVEVVRSGGFLERLLSLFRKKRGAPGLGEVQEKAMWQESFYCEIRQVEAPDWLAGIVESARQVKPQVIMLAPEVQERLGANGLGDLKRHLGALDSCTLILLTRGLALAIEPCGRLVRQPSYVHHKE